MNLINARAGISRYALIIFSAILYAAAFPNQFIERGAAPAAWFSYIGVLITIARTRLLFTPLWGAFFGALSVTLHNYWLSLFHPLAGLIAGLLFACYYAALFPALKCVLAFRSAPLAAFAQCCLWTGFEYLRTLGFMGYSYGISGYSQWTFPALIKIADVAGVWIVSALIIFPQACIAGILSDFSNGGRRIFTALRRAAFPLGIWLVFFIAAILYGVLSAVDYTGARKLRVALVQPASNPWKADIAEFRKELSVLKRLSDRALAETPAPDLVVWPETAFVPSLYYHGRYRVDADSSALVREAVQYLASKDTPFLIGNNEAKRVADGKGGERIAEYNAALLFDGGEIRNRYYKTHLVPFTEYFPYKTIFPSFYQFLLDADSHFWEKGTEQILFNRADVSFCAPICFEDTFGADVRAFVKQGAQLIVNISNDSWSHSLSTQYQHLSIAVFRAVETGRAMARSTATGQTCAIDPNGRLLAMSAPWEETVLTVDVPILNGKTLYTRFGDWLPRTLLLFGIVCLLCSLFLNHRKRSIMVY